MTKLNKWESIKLRASLFRIWFMKNLTVFLKILVLVLIILIATGCISSSSLLGKLFGIGALSEAIRDALTGESENVGDIILNIIAVVLSVLVSLGTMTVNLKRIGLSDIKSKNVKMALVRANMYFNTDGQLVKRVEKGSQTDLDGDGKVGDIDEDTIPKEGFFTGIIRSIQELWTIMTVKVEDDSEVKKVLKDNNMVNSAQAVLNIDDNKKKEADVGLTTEEALDKSSISEINSNISVELATASKEITETSDENEIKEKIRASARLKAWFKNIFEKFKKLFKRDKHADESKEEVTDEIPETKDTKIIEEEKIPETTSEENNENIKEEVKESETEETKCEKQETSEIKEETQTEEAVVETAVSAKKVEQTQEKEVSSNIIAPSNIKKEDEELDNILSKLKRKIK